MTVVQNQLETVDEFVLVPLRAFPVNCLDSKTAKLFISHGLIELWSEGNTLDFTFRKRGYNGFAACD
jgi:hypothetical protein